MLFVVRDTHNVYRLFIHSFIRSVIIYAYLSRAFSVTGPVLGSDKGRVKQTKPHVLVMGEVSLLRLEVVVVCLSAPEISPL